MRRPSESGRFLPAPAAVRGGKHGLTAPPRRRALSKTCPLFPPMQSSIIAPMIIQPTSEQWDAFVTSQRHSHILQTCAWGELKSRFGWSADRIAVTYTDRIAAGALVLF